MNPALARLPAYPFERLRALPRGARVDPETMLLPVNGTCEALFALVQAGIDPGAGAVVAMPNPFYQIYQGAALLAGAEPYFLSTTAASDYVPDLEAVPHALWRRCRPLKRCAAGARRAARHRVRVRLPRSATAASRN
jgi:N-succinyldiaminopimelate aminotransferase